VSTRSPATAAKKELLFRIGEVAKLTELTTRTLRYWEEQGLVAPSAYGNNGERLYAATDMARVTRIRDLQRLLGFSLAEVRMVLDTEEVDVLDRVRSELRSGGGSPQRRRNLVEEAITANDQLLARLDETLARIHAFRDERAASAKRLRARRRALEAEIAGASEETP
jgi:DNA-binding transcriptional MerR regulator